MTNNMCQPIFGSDETPRSRSGNSAKRVRALRQDRGLPNLHRVPHRAVRSVLRGGAQVDRTGTTDCWELDALEPTVIDSLLDTAIREIVDSETWDAALRNEELEKIRLAEGCGQFRSGMSLTRALLHGLDRCPPSGRRPRDVSAAGGIAAPW